MAATVLMLQALATQGSATRSGTDQEATGALVCGGPDQITNALEAKHRVVNIKRQHWQTVHCVAGSSGCPGRNRTRLGNTFFENLSVFRFPVIQNRANVLRLI